MGQGALEGLGDEACAELGGAVPQPRGRLGPVPPLGQRYSSKGAQVGGVVKVAPPQLCMACLSSGLDQGLNACT